MKNDTASHLYDRIYRVCRSRRLSHDDSMDVAQDVLCKALKSYGKISQLESWVIACTFNKIRDLSKARLRFEAYAQGFQEKEYHDELRDEDELRFVVQVMLECLTDKQRMAVERWLKQTSSSSPLTGKDRILIFRAFQKCREHFPYVERLVT